MATNDFVERNTTTDNYDIYGSEGQPTSLPGSPGIDSSGHLIIPPDNDWYYFPSWTLPNSTFDPDPNNTGPMTDFWTNFPIMIDTNGQVFYYGKDTRINTRGPAGATNIRFDDLTSAQLAQITGPAGQDGINGTNGIDGQDGENGLSAYELWLKENGWLDDPEDHPIEEFFEYLANIEDTLIKEGTGTGSLLLNNRGTNNTAAGVSALASGYGTAASGNYSSAFGKGTIANNDYSTAFGTYNEGKNNSIFEVGFGTASVRNNIFEIDESGNVTAKGEIVDGGGNTLSDKVDKISGKGLSTNDFTNGYKNFLDNYTVDISLDPSSSNPVTNAAITTAINNISRLNGKSAVEQSTSNTDLAFGFVGNTSAQTLDVIKWTTGLRWNPNKNILKNNNISTSTFSNIVSFGTTGLAAAENDQIILGKYNSPNVGDFLEIGWGISSELKNILEISKLGDLTVAGEIEDGSGNVLSDKQDILTFDSLPTQNSLNPVTSGGLYNLFTSFGVNVNQGTLNIPGLTNLQNQITALTARVVALEAAVTAIGNPRRIPDDALPSNIYTYGINNDQFYIKLIEQPEEEEEEENE